MADLSFGDFQAALPPRRHVEAIREIDRYDREDLTAIEKEMREFRSARRKLIEAAATGDHLGTDTFLGFYKVQAEIRDTHEMKPSHVTNQIVQQELRQSPEWRRLLQWTEGDLVGAAMAFITCEEELEALLDRAQKRLEEHVKRLQQKMDDLEGAEQDERDLDEMIAEWSEDGTLTDEELEALSKVKEGLQDGIDKLQEQVDEAGDELAEAGQQTVRAALPGLRQAMKEATEEAAATSSTAVGFGLEPGELQRMDPKKRLELARRLNTPRFRKMAELIGAFSWIAHAEQMRKVDHSFEEIYDVDLGNDLARLVPSEMLNLTHPQAKLDFQRRFTERKLFQYELRGDEKVGKGSIIYCGDQSGSMMGEREMWSKAVGLACASIAREQKRGFYGIHFGSAREIAKFDFRRSEDMTLERVLEFAEAFFGGGTDFQTPLSLALKLLEEEHAATGRVEGDILFATDGQCNVRPDWLKSFKGSQERLGFRVFGVVIGGDPKAEPLHTICDGNVVTISNLLSADEVRDIFRSL